MGVTPLPIGDSHGCLCTLSHSMLWLQAVRIRKVNGDRCFLLYPYVFAARHALLIIRQSQVIAAELPCCFFRALDGQDEDA
jgi:hypothetical protein